MFLEEELENAVEQNLSHQDIGEILIKRVEGITDRSFKGFSNGIRQIDFVWRKFCEKYPKYNKDFLRDTLKETDVYENLKPFLRWE